MLEAALWGLATSGSLLVGALLSYTLRPGHRTVGLTMALGSGALISAVAYDLVQDAFDERVAWPALGLGVGALAFFAGDVALDRRGGERRSMRGGHDEPGNPLAIVLGAVLDGLPESAIIGATLAEGGAVSWAFVAAVFLSNLPEAIGATTGLIAAGWSRRSIALQWLAVVAASTAAAALGWLAFDAVEGLDASFLLAFAAGALLVMLADTLMPEAFELGGRAAGLLTTLGFALAFTLSQLE
jgi:ZIP family zinc transporter